MPRYQLLAQQVIQGRISQEPQPTSSSLISQPEFQELIQLTKGQITTGTEVTKSPREDTFILLLARTNLFSTISGFFFTIFFFF